MHISSLFTLKMLIYGVKANTPYASSVHCKQTGLEVNVEKAEYVSVPWTASSTKSQNTCNKSFESVVKLEYLLITLTHQNYAQKEINSSRMHLGNACYHLVQNHLPNSLLPKNVKFKIHTTMALHVVLNGCETWSHKVRGT